VRRAPDIDRASLDEWKVGIDRFEIHGIDVAAVKAFRERLRSRQCLQAALVVSLQAGEEAGALSLLLCLKFAPRLLDHRTEPKTKVRKVAKSLLEVAAAIPWLVSIGEPCLDPSGKTGPRSVRPLEPHADARKVELLACYLSDDEASIVQGAAPILKRVGKNLLATLPHRRQGRGKGAFIRYDEHGFREEWDLLARRFKLRDRDDLGAKFFFIIFGKSLDPDSFKRERLRQRQRGNKKA
jgi:hypothetical protein